MNSLNYLSVVLCILLYKCVCAEDDLSIKVEAVNGQSVELPCNVTAENEDDSLSILAWFRKGSATAFYSRDWREGGKGTPQSSRYRLVTSETEEYKLQIVSVGPTDAGTYICLADFFASPSHKTHVQLVVIEPTQYLWVIDENDTQVAEATVGVNTSRNIGPYYVGDTVNLACIAFEGKPVASPLWMTKGRRLKNAMSSLSEQRLISNLTYGPLQREDHGRVFTCYASNNDKIAPLTVDITVDMHLPPDLVALHITDLDSEATQGRVLAGDVITLECRVLGARPLPPLMWQVAGSKLENPIQNITMKPAQRLLVSKLQLPVIRSYDESEITCCAPDNLRGSENLTCAQPLPLIVSYAPVLKIAVDKEVENNTLALVKGSSITLGCNYEANPSLQELSWYFKEDLVDIPGDERDAVQRVLDLVEVTEEHAGEYACAATNDVGRSYSEPIIIDVTYPAYCLDETVVEYGIAENDAINLTCIVKAHPEPTTYRWMIVENPNTTESLLNTTETEQNSLIYTRPTGTALSVIYCWGVNGIPTEGLAHTPCMFNVTDKTIPRPPTNCEAKKHASEIIVSCEKGHDGGLPQQFKFTALLENSGEQLVSIINIKPHFMFQEPKDEPYKLTIVAFNEKGESQVVEIETTSEGAGNTVTNITTLALSLCGGVLIIALAACGLVLCTYERSSRTDLPRDHSDPPLCAYNTEESNCETCHDSDDGSDCNVRRTESFRRAVRRPSKNFDVRRTSSFHSARYMNDVLDQDNIKYIDMPRHTNACRVHSLQNINKKKDMDTLCDHLVLRLPPETNYNVPRPMNTFYTMPRKNRHKQGKEISDDHSEITQASDGFSLPPPPDEYGTYRAGTRIRDIPKSTPAYTTMIRNNSTGRVNTKISPQYNQASMNATGLPTSGQHSVYSYPDNDHHGHHDAPTGVFPAYFIPKESGL